MKRLWHIINGHTALALLALILLCLPALHPFLQGDMPRTDDGTLHLYRAIALDHAIRSDGTLYPRYAPGLVYGYGAALFNYFPPSSYYAVVAFHWLGLHPIHAWLAAMILYIVIGAAGAWRLGRLWGGEIAGWLTAAAYTYAPYMIFDAVTRGTISELAGLVVLPWAMWGFTRLTFFGQRRDFLAAVSLFAIFITMHNIVTLQGTLFLIVYCAALWGASRWQPAAFVRLLSAGVLAVLMTAFFWLPALAEARFTRIEGVAQSLNSIDVTASLRSLAEILALPATADPTQLHAPIPITLGWIQILLAAGGIAFGWRQALAKQRALLIAAALLVLLTVLLQLQASAPIWRTLPLIGFSQFAWRILGPGSLFLALAAGLGGALILNRIGSQSLKNGLFFVFLIAIVTYSIPWLYVSYFSPDADSIQDAQQVERQTGQLTLSSYSEYLPVWVETPPDAVALQERFATSEQIARLPDELMQSVVSARWWGSRAALKMESAQPQTLIFDWLYMPGWQAHIDHTTGREALIVYPLAQTGLVAVDIPAGSYDLQIAYAGTDLQHVAVGISALACGVLLLALIFVRWQPSAQQQSAAGSKLVVWVAVIGLALFLFKALIVDHINSPFRTARLTGDSIAGSETTLNANFSGLMHLIGYTVEDRVKSGKNAVFSVFWALQDQQIDRDFSSIIEVVDQDGNVITQTSAFYPGGIATSQWVQGMYVEQTGILTLPDFTPPGVYRVFAGLYDPTTGQALDLLDAAGNPAGVRVALDSIEILRPDQVAAWTGASVGQWDALTLLDVRGIPASASVGDAFVVEWLWELGATSTQAPQAQLIWLDVSGQEQAFSRTLELNALYPVASWLAGDRWRGWQQLYVPANLAAGDYQVAIEVADRAVPVAAMQVTVPERSYALPPIQTALDVGWQNSIFLRGANYTVTMVTLYWQTEQLVDRNLRLFVQALNADGSVAAVSDGIPVNWTRPTTGWAVGEIVTTSHEFSSLPAGRYTLLIGWYDAQTGLRVPLADGSDDSLRLEDALNIPQP